MYPMFSIFVGIWSVACFVGGVYLGLRVARRDELLYRSPDEVAEEPIEADERVHVPTVSDDDYEKEIDGDMRPEDER